MKLKELLNLKSAELIALKDKISAGDSDAIQKAQELADEIKCIKEKIAKAEEINGIIDGLGTKDSGDHEDKGGEKEPTLRNWDLKSLITNPGVKSMEIKAATDTHVAPTVTVVDTNVVDPRPTLNVRSIFGTESISGNALTYYLLGTMEGSITNVLEGGAKPQVHIPHDTKTVALRKIAAHIKESDELLQDGAFLESAVRNRLRYEFDKVVENYLLTTLSGTSGIQTGDATITFDSILKAKQAVRNVTGYAADALVMNPADLETLLLTKDSNQQYLLGGPAYGSYGNGTYSANPRIWGLNVVESAQMAAGTCFVGSFKIGSSIVTKAGEGLRVEVSNSNEDDFIKNKVTVRIEERLVLATRVPAAFVLVGTASP